MTGLTTPTDHADAYTWAAVLTAHAAIGMVLAVGVHAQAVIAAIPDDVKTWAENHNG